MASLKDLRRRISSVKNTQQITKAMKMVAAAKLHKAQSAIQSLRPYSEKLDEISKRIVTELSVSFKNEEQAQKELIKIHPLLRSNENAPRALIIIGSDKGLCGSYNTNVFKHALNYLKEHQEEKINLFFYGKKVRNSLRKVGFEGELNEEFWAGPLTPSRSSKVAAKFAEEYVAGKFSAVDVIYTEFKSAMTQTSKDMRILPLKVEVDVDASENADKKVEVDPNHKEGFIFEPNRVDLLQNLIPKQVNTTFYRVFADSFASEMGSKMSSMDSATRNAGDMISRLTLVMNRTRQASITKELMEIVGGAEALKG